MKLCLLLFPLSLTALFLFTAVYPSIAMAESGEGFLRAAIGSLEVTALSDATGEMGFDIIHGASPENIRRAAADAGLGDTARAFPSFVNAFVVKTPADLILVDTGNGPLAGLSQSLRRAGISPDDITAVLLTHFHGDHVSGLLTGEGLAAFPKAAVYADTAEDNYWMGDPGRAGRPKQLLAPYIEADRYKLFSPGQEILPGVTVVELYGHTPGHVGFYFKGGERDLLAWGDIIHVRYVQFKYPEATMSYDVDPERAAESRKKIYSDASEKGYYVAGAHLPFPGIGQVVKADGAYDYKPIAE
jgi:glyoxylase-like metal-dependent hydrolase (beta-lactamase superfamily II)